MEQMTLKASKRTEKAKVLREKAIIPAVSYGHGIESMNIQVPYSDFQKLYREAGESTIFTLEVEDSKLNVLVKDVQLDDVMDTFTHIDFYAVKMDEEITTEVELSFVGTSNAVATEGGILVKSIDIVEVTCLPVNLPSEIEVDISSLVTFDDSISIKDLVVSDKITITQDSEETVATVTPPRSEEELDALNAEVEVDVENIEGVTKETDDDGGEDDVDSRGGSKDDKKDSK